MCHAIPHMHTMQGHNSPSSFGYSFTYIGMIISSFFEILNQRQWMDGFGQSRELDQQYNRRYTYSKSIHSPTSMHQSTTSRAGYSRHNTTSHWQSTCIRYCSEFCISGVGIWVLAGANPAQWIWYYQYGQERWLTYMRAYSPRRNLNSPC